MNVERCPRCNEFLIAEQKASHTCRIAVNDVREIFLDHMTEGAEDNNGDLVKVGWGLDHILYRLILCKHNPPHTAKRQFTDPDAKQGLDNPVLEKA